MGLVRVRALSATQPRARRPIDAVRCPLCVHRLRRDNRRWRPLCVNHCLAHVQVRCLLILHVVHAKCVEPVCARITCRERDRSSIELTRPLGVVHPVRPVVQPHIGQAATVRIVRPRERHVERQRVLVSTQSTTVHPRHRCTRILDRSLAIRPYRLVPRIVPGLHPVPVRLTVLKTPESVCQARQPAACGLFDCEQSIRPTCQCVLDHTPTPRTTFWRCPRKRVAYPLRVGRLHDELRRIWLVRIDCRHGVGPTTGSSHIARAVPCHCLERVETIAFVRIEVERRNIRGGRSTSHVLPFHSEGAVQEHRVSSTGLVLVNHNVDVETRFVRVRRKSRCSRTRRM